MPQATQGESAKCPPLPLGTSRAPVLGSRAMQRTRVAPSAFDPHEGCMAMAIVEANSIPEGLAFDDVLLRPGHAR